MNAGVGHDPVAGFQARDQILLLLLPFFLRPDHHKVHDDENEYQRHKERADAAAWHRLRCRGLSLSENRLEHIRN